MTIGATGTAGGGVMDAATAVHEVAGHEVAGHEVAGHEVKHGRPRDPHVDTAIRHAALDLLVEEGFARMSMEGVASRAGVGKAAIYRRWDCKTALVVDSIHDLMSSANLDWPRTDNIRADLEAIFTLFLEKMRGMEGELMSAVVSELVRNPELAATVQGQFVACRKKDMLDRILNAMADGQLPPGDAELLAEVGFAVIHNRMLLSHGPLTDDLPTRLVEQFFPVVPSSPLPVPVPVPS